MNETSCHHERYPLDLHCHTSVGSDCSDFTIDEIVQVVTGNNLEAFAVTDHHSVEGAKVLAARGVPVIIGVEIYVKDSRIKDYGEFLVFAPEGLEKMVEGAKGPKITLREAKNCGFLDGGNLVIWAHPLFDDEDWMGMVLAGIGPFIHAVEIYNYSSYHAQETTEILSDNRASLKKCGASALIEVANSDAHEIGHYMKAFNIFKTPVRSSVDLIQAVKAGDIIIRTP